MPCCAGCSHQHYPCISCLLSPTNILLFIWLQVSFHVKTIQNTSLNSLKTFTKCRNKKTLRKNIKKHTFLHLNRHVVVNFLFCLCVEVSTIVVASAEVLKQKYNRKCSYFYTLSSLVCVFFYVFLCLFLFIFVSTAIYMKKHICFYRVHVSTELDACRQLKFLPKCQPAVRTRKNRKKQGKTTRKQTTWSKQRS